MNEILYFGLGAITGGGAVLLIIGIYAAFVIKKQVKKPMNMVKDMLGSFGIDDSTFEKMMGKDDDNGEGAE